MRTKRITAILSIIAVLTVFSASSGIAALRGICAAERYENSRGDAVSADESDGSASTSVGSGTDCVLRNVPEPHAQAAFSEFLCSILRRAP